MRWMRLWLVASLLTKAVVLGAWWWASVGDADRAGAAEGPAGDAGVPSELLARSRGFRELLEAVRQRGADLDRREREMAARETALRTLEQTLGQGAPDAKAAPAPAAAAAVPEAPPPCNPAVTKVYQNMKPEEAAPILDRLDDETTRAIFACMKEKQIGAFLAAMNKDRAVALTKVLAGVGATAQ